MYSVLTCAAAGALCIGAAKADETLKFRVVQHVSANHNLQVGDVSGHLLGIIRLPGPVFFQMEAGEQPW